MDTRTSTSSRTRPERLMFLRHLPDTVTEMDAPVCCLVIPSSRGEQLVRCALVEDAKALDACFTKAPLASDLNLTSAFHHMVSMPDDNGTPQTTDLVSVRVADTGEHMLLMHGQDMDVLTHLARRFGGTLYPVVGCPDDDLIEFTADDVPPDWGRMADERLQLLVRHRGLAAIERAMGIDLTRHALPAQREALDAILAALIGNALADKEGGWDVGWRERIRTAMAPIYDMHAQLRAYAPSISHAILSAIIRGVPTDETMESMDWASEGRMRTITATIVRMCLTDAREAVTCSFIEPSLPSCPPHPVTQRTP